MSAQRIRIGVNGALGRMGRLVCAEALAAPDMNLAAAIERSGHGSLGRTVKEVLGLPSGLVIAAAGEDTPLLDVVVDFSTPDAMVSGVGWAAERGVRFVSGTTGLLPEHRSALHQASQSIAVMWAPNMSLGMNAMVALAQQAARMLPDFDLGILETHHRGKKDAPSGSALAIKEAAGKGNPSGVTRGEVTVVSLRLSDVVGEHSAVFAGSNETLELRHEARDRRVFACGALSAARWIANRAPGYYGMNHVLGMKG